jgi:hypothetical protein
VSEPAAGGSQAVGSYSFCRHMVRRDQRSTRSPCPGHTLKHTWTHVEKRVWPKVVYAARARVTTCNCLTVRTCEACQGLARWRARLWASFGEPGRDSSLQPEIKKRSDKERRASVWLPSEPPVDSPRATGITRLPQDRDTQRSPGAMRGRVCLHHTQSLIGAHPSRGSPMPLTVCMFRLTL